MTEARPIFVGAAGLILMAVLLGGGTRQGLWSDAFIQLLSLLFLAVLFWTQRPSQLLPADRLLRAILAAICVLPVLQLIDLPPLLWRLLPGREIFAAGYEQAGVALPWLPISLDPAATMRSLLTVIPPLAIFLIALQLDYAERRLLSLLFLALGLLSFLLGLLQLMQGPSSPLRFFPITNTGDSVGFFANRNHYAILLACLVPVAAAWAQRALVRQDRNRLFWIAIWLIVFACLLLGIGMAHSRAALLLAGLAVLASFGIAGSRGLPQSRRVLAVAVGIGCILIIHFAFFQLSARFETDPLEDYRLTMARITVEGLWAFFPVGSGFGTFEAAYRMFEPVDVLSTFYVNHAHDDWLELLFEGGLPALVILLAALYWFGRSILSVWRSPSDAMRSIDVALARSASIVIIVLLLHSIVDYPLRTTAISVLLAWSAAMLIAPKPATARSEARPETSSQEPHRSHSRRRRRPPTGWR